MNKEVSAVILAGGRSTRMGVNKAFMEVHGQPLIDGLVSFLGQIFPEVILVVNEPLLYLHLPATVTTDIYKGKGSFGGLYTGLFHASREHAFVVPCDMPFLNRDFITFMIDRIDGENHAIVPEPRDGFQPLHAIYSKKILRVMAGMMTRDKLKIIDLYRTVKTKVIPAEVIDGYDKNGLMFFNINSPEDLELYLKTS